MKAKTLLRIIILNLALVSLNLVESSAGDEVQNGSWPDRAKILLTITASKLASSLKNISEKKFQQILYSQVPQGQEYFPSNKVTSYWMANIIENVRQPSFNELEKSSYSGIRNFTYGTEGDTHYIMALKPYYYSFNDNSIGERNTTIHLSQLLLHETSHLFGFTENQARKFSISLAQYLFAKSSSGKKDSSFCNNSIAVISKKISLVETISGYYQKDRYKYSVSIRLAVPYDIDINNSRLGVKLTTNGWKTNVNLQAIPSSELIDSTLNVWEIKYLIPEELQSPPASIDFLPFVSKNFSTIFSCEAPYQVTHDNLKIFPSEVSLYLVKEECGNYYRNKASYYIAYVKGHPSFFHKNPVAYFKFSHMIDKQLVPIERYNHDTYFIRIPLKLAAESAELTFEWGVNNPSYRKINQHSVQLGPNPIAKALPRDPLNGIYQINFSDANINHSFIITAKAFSTGNGDQRVETLEVQNKKNNEFSVILNSTNFSPYNNVTLQVNVVDSKGFSYNWEQVFELNNQITVSQGLSSSLNKKLSDKFNILNSDLGLKLAKKLKVAKKLKIHFHDAELFQNELYIVGFSKYQLIKNSLGINMYGTPLKQLYIYDLQGNQKSKRPFNYQGKIEVNKYFIIFHTGHSFMVYNHQLEKLGSWRGEGETSGSFGNGGIKSIALDGTLLYVSTISLGIQVFDLSLLVEYDQVF